MNDHLSSLRTREAHEVGRLATATNPKEIALRTVWLAQIRKEIAAEERFLGMDAIECDLTDEELLAELTAP